MPESASMLVAWFRSHAPTFAPYYDSVDDRFNNMVDLHVQHMLTGLQENTVDACVKGRDAAWRLSQLADSFHDVRYAARCADAYVCLCRQLARHVLSGGSA